MRDEIDGRLWVAHGQQFGRDVSGFLHQLARSFERLNAIEWDAPWKRTDRRAGGAGLA